MAYIKNQSQCSSKHSSAEAVHANCTAHLALSCSSCGRIERSYQVHYPGFCREKQLRRHKIDYLETRHWTLVALVQRCEEKQSADLMALLTLRRLGAANATIPMSRRLNPISKNHTDSLAMLSNGIVGQEFSPQFPHPLPLSSSSTSPTKIAS